MDWNRSVTVLHMAIPLAVLIASGCATSPSNNRLAERRVEPQADEHQVVSESILPDEAASAKADQVPNNTTMKLVSHEEVSVLPDEPLSSQPMSLHPVPAGPHEAYSLDNFEAMALAGNPTLQQAQTQVRAAEGAAFQAGLYPNPIVGYQGEFDQIGATRDETWNGGFVAQEFVTGGKLRLSREKWCQRVQIARTNYHAQQHRVLNDVRVQFYRALAAQKMVEIQRELLANGEDSLQTHREMLNVGQTNQSGLLTAEVDLQRNRLNLNRAEKEFQHAWRTLASFAGSPNLAAGIVTGGIESAEQPLDWNAALSQLLSSSPELQAARQKIQHDRITVEREKVEPIPNLLFDVTSIHSPVADTTQTTLNVGLPLPIFDRNQGTVQQAQADLSQSHAEVRRLQLELRNRLATRFRDYETSWQRVADYDSTMLPKARQAYDMLHESYKARRAAWPDVLMAQRMYLTLRAEQVSNHLMYRESDVAIRGMLLTGGLMVPPAPVGAGHIDAVAKPR